MGICITLGSSLSNLWELLFPCQFASQLTNHLGQNAHCTEGWVWGEYGADGVIPALITIFKSHPHTHTYTYWIFKIYPHTHTHRVFRILFGYIHILRHNTHWVQ